MCDNFEYMDALEVQMISQDLSYLLLLIDDDCTGICTKQEQFQLDGSIW